MLRRMLLGLVMAVLVIECVRAEDDTAYSADVRKKARELATVVAGDSSREEFDRVYMAILQATNAPCCGSVRTAGVGVLPRSGEEVAIDWDYEETYQENLARLQAEDPDAIINGLPTETSEFSEVVLIRMGAQGICTGTLIGPNVVLSAKHCFESGVRPDMVQVRVGSSSANSRSFRVGRIAVHPSADLAVLVLAESISNQVAMPAKIASQSDIRASASARIVGFGLTERNTSGTKMRADVAFARYDCRPGDPFGCRPGEMVLAGGDSDTCHGDSGGPAMIRTPNGFVLAGVTSRAVSGSKTIRIGGRDYACGFGGVYVNARHYFADIQRMAEQNGGILAGASTDTGVGSGVAADVTAPVSAEVQAALDQLKNGISQLERALQAR